MLAQQYIHRKELKHLATNTLIATSLKYDMYENGKNA